MKIQHVLAALMACVVLSTGIGFAIATASEPDTAAAKKGGSKQLKAIAKELKTLNAEVHELRLFTGGASGYSGDSLLEFLKQVEDHTDGTCRALASPISC